MGLPYAPGQERVHVLLYGHVRHYPCAWLQRRRSAHRQQTKARPFTRQGSVSDYSATSEENGRLLWVAQGYFNIQRQAFAVMDGEELSPVVDSIQQDAALQQS